MKRFTLSILLCLLLVPARSQDRLYVATDRQAYLAGDPVYCSLFCTDDSGRRNGFSAVSYLELISTDGTVAEAKVALFNGRGAGFFRIPASTPTGNYRLVAYTARSQAVLEGSRMLSIYNTYSRARVKDGVSFVPADDYRPYSAPETQDGVQLSLPARVRQDKDVTLVVSGLAQKADLWVSVFHEDGLEQLPASEGLAGFQHGKPAGKGDRPGEYEGEIIYATVEGLVSGGSNRDDQATAILSTAGSPANVYVGRSDEDGRISFYTGNIFGDRELVCEVFSILGKQGYINLASPFTHPEVPAAAPLVLSQAQQSALVSRKAALQAESTQLDTLVRFLPKREDLLLDGITPIHYHLDDYTRFPTVREVCVEIVNVLQFARVNKEWRLRMVVSDGTDSRRFLQDHILVMMDGVVLPDQAVLADFDAMLLDDVYIYQQAVALGGVIYNGVVNFVTKKNYVTALPFPDNVRVVDFKGVSYPVAYPGEVGGSGPDRRQLLYWNPALEAPAAGSVRIPLHTPAYPGRFRAKVEGWLEDGTPVSASYCFEVE